MAFDLQSARHWARGLMGRALMPGALAVDATMGNGHDTLWLAELVGPAGRVFAFDVQAQAVERTRARLQQAGLIERATLIRDGHEAMAQYVAQPVDGVVFNLGWLPGGDKERTTRAGTSLAALRAALSLLKPGGLTTICVYPGHPEGAREEQALLEFARALDEARYDVVVSARLNASNQPPLLLAIQKRAER